MPVQIVVPDYCRAPRVYPISLIILHSTRGLTSMDQQFAATVEWFRQGGGGSAEQGWGANADVLIGAAGDVAEFGDWRTTRANWSAGFGHGTSPLWYGADEHALSIELAQPDPPQPYTSATLTALVAFLRPVLAELDIPAQRVPWWSQSASEGVPSGLIGHEDTANGRRLFKSDPGGLFPWARVLTKLAEPQQLGLRIERETTSRYVGWNVERGAEEHEIVTREFIYR